MARMAPRRAAGLVFAIMGLPMFFTGAMLGLLLGFEYSMTSFAIGAVFLVIGIIVMALPAPPRPAPSVPTFAFGSVPVVPRLAATPTIPPEPRKNACPSCGASPSRVGPSGLTTCEYSGATYLI